MTTDPRPDREALEAALERFDINLPRVAAVEGDYDGTTPRARSAYLDDALLLIAAARAYLNLTAGEQDLYILPGDAPETETGGGP